MIKDPCSGISVGGRQVNNLILQADGCWGSRKGRDLGAVGKVSLSKGFLEEVRTELSFREWTKMRFYEYKIPNFHGSMHLSFQGSKMLFFPSLQIKVSLLALLSVGALLGNGEDTNYLKCIWIRLLFLIISHISVISACRDLLLF